MTLVYHIAHRKERNVYCWSKSSSKGRGRRQQQRSRRNNRTERQWRWRRQRRHPQRRHPCEEFDNQEDCPWTLSCTLCGMHSLRNQLIDISPLLRRISFCFPIKQQSKYENYISPSFSYFAGWITCRKKLEISMSKR